jgi:hypothetical protein
MRNPSSIAASILVTVTVMRRSLADFYIRAPIVVDSPIVALMVALLVIIIGTTSTFSVAVLSSFSTAAAFISTAAATFINGGLATHVVNLGVETIVHLANSCHFSHHLNIASIIWN